MPSFSLDEFRARPPAGELIPSSPSDLDSDALAEFPSEARSWRSRALPALPAGLRSRPHLLLPLAAAVGLGVLGGLWWVYASPAWGGTGRPAAPLPAAFLAISEPVPLPAAPESALGFVAPGVFPSARRSREEATGEPLQRPPAVAASRPFSSAAGSRAGSARPQATAPPTPVDETVYASFADQPPAPVDAARIYSSDDADVEPPVAARAWFFTAPPEGVSRSFLTQIEVVVSATGEVDSAKIVAGPRTYTDGMILSAIKGGKFRPAQKGGQPVPYRQALWVVVPDR